MEPQLWAPGTCAHQVPLAHFNSVLTVCIRQDTTAAAGAPTLPTETTSTCCLDVAACRQCFTVFTLPSRLPHLRDCGPGHRCCRMCRLSVADCAAAPSQPCQWTIRPSSCGHQAAWVPFLLQVQVQVAGVGPTLLPPTCWQTWQVRHCHAGAGTRHMWQRWEAGMQVHQWA